MYGKTSVRTALVAIGASMVDPPARSTSVP
jgi:hypothetical protein